MTDHSAYDGSRFGMDINRLEDLLDDLECYLMFPEQNPINKKDIGRICRLIENMAVNIKERTRQAGYAYFEDPAPEGYDGRC